MSPVLTLAVVHPLVHLSFIIAVPLTIAFLHFLLYLFDRRAVQNLYVAVIGTSFVGMALSDLGLLPTESQWILVPTLLLAIPAFVYSMFLPKRPRQYTILVGAAIIIAAVGLVRPGWAELPAKFFVVAIIVETFRVAIVHWDQKQPGSILPTIGMCVFGVTGFFDVMIDLDVMQSVFGTTNPYLYGGSFMILTMSIHLAHSYTTMNADLERQLARVRELIDQMLAHERVAREEEVRRRLVEADNERKTRELEQARALQLSMIPQEIPDLSDWDVSASMEIATEVGGDYYDFHIGAGGVLTVAVGDAVGHGMRAGIIVAATKSLFATLRDDESVGEALARFDDVLRSMRLSRAHMCLLLARFEANRVEIANAGMPAPVLRTSRGEVRELDLFGLPLGVRGTVPRPTRSFELNREEMILLMSDGLPEARSENEIQMFGYDRVLDTLREMREPTTKRVIVELGEAVRNDLGAESATDDMTLVAVQRK